MAAGNAVRVCKEGEAQVAPLLETMAGVRGGKTAIGSYPVSQQGNNMQLDMIQRQLQAPALAF